MSFLLILIAVILILIVVTVLFAALKFIFWLLPIAILASLVIWLIYYFSNLKTKRDFKKSKRKKAQNVSVKDIKD